MRNLEQWLIWRLEERDGKPTKMPYSPRNGSRASSTDPATWASFSEAVAAHRTAGEDSGGIGFVFTEDDAYVGVDLDNCRNADTGEIEAWAQEIVSELNSYTEVSPSGTGVHIICRGELPPGRNRKGSVEAYQSGRYFTVTGSHLKDTPQSVEERTAELASVARRVFGEPESNGNGHVHTEPHRASASNLEDGELIRRAHEAKGGEEFARLWAGDTAGYAYEDNEGHSEADLALCSRLAFWTGPEPSRVDALFRESGLYRAKWDKRHYGDGRTYGEGTIARALDGKTEFYTPPAARLSFGANVGVKLSDADANGHGSGSSESPEDTADEEQAAEEPGLLLSEVEPEEVSWLWQSRIPLRKLGLGDGDPGDGKSAMATDIAARVSVGADMPDGSPCGVAPSGVVLLSAEDGLSDTIRPRLDAAGADASKVLALATTQDSEGHERMLSIPEDIPLIERGIQRVDAKLVIVDPLMAFLSGEANAHKDQDTRKALAPLAALAERTGAAVLVIRHLNKASGGNALYRGGGSIGIIGAARSALLVAKDPDDENRRVLAPMKSNLAMPAPSLAFTLEEAANGAVRVAWRGESELDASKLLATSAAKEEGDAHTEAKEFLEDMLRDGPVPASEMKAEAEDAGISEKTLKRAKQSIGVSTYREGEEGKRGGGKWLWEIPRLGVRPQDGENDLGGQAPSPDPLNQNEGDEQGEFPIGKGNDLGGQAPESLGGQSRLGPLNQQGRRLTEQEAREVQKLISGGMDAKLARDEVLGVDRF